jgi:hypothetical protein
MLAAVHHATTNPDAAAAVVVVLVGLFGFGPALFLRKGN